MRSYLVVANQTLGGAHLLTAVRERMRAGECCFHVIVPATHAHEHATWTEGDAQALAQERLDRALAAFQELGARSPARAEGSARGCLDQGAVSPRRASFYRSTSAGPAPGATGEGSRDSP